MTLNTKPALKPKPSPLPQRFPLASGDVIIVLLSQEILSMTKHTFLVALSALALASCGDDSATNDPPKGETPPESKTVTTLDEALEFLEVVGTPTIVCTPLGTS